MAAFILADALDSTGAGPTYGGATGDERYDGFHAYQVNLTGAPTAVTIAIEGSLDGLIWHELVEHVFDSGELTATSALFTFADKPVTFIRANLTTLTAGTAPTVTVLGRTA